MISSNFDIRYVDVVIDKKVRHKFSNFEIVLYVTFCEKDQTFYTSITT